MRPNWVGRRQAERRTCSIKAQARYYDGSPPVDCVITDFSPAGARMLFPQGEQVPSAFDLFIPSRADTRHALVRWQTPEAVGVEFSQARGNTDNQRVSELLVRMSRLEEEIRAMRASAALTAGEKPAAPPPASPAPAGPAVAALSEEDRATIASLGSRVQDLEKRNADVLEALRHALALLVTLRENAAPRAKVGGA